MPRFSANLSFFRQDLLFLDHFAAAAREGFDTLRHPGPRPEPEERVADALKAHGPDPPPSRAARSFTPSPIAAAA